LRPEEDAGEEGKRPTSSESSKPSSKPCPGKAFVKACSEAIFFAVAHCIKQDSTLAMSIRNNLHPTSDHHS
jgi:hypothetical protein